MRVFYLLTTVFLLWGCSSEKSPIEPQIEILSSDIAQTLTAEPGTTTIHFTANGSWNAYTSDDWCTVSPSSGEAGNITLTISSEANTEYDSRSTTVTIECGTLSKEAIITQEQKDDILLTSPEIEMEEEGGAFSIEVQANVAFEYEIEESTKEWIKPATSTRSLTSSTLHFFVEKNEDLAERDGSITIYNKEISRVISIHQQGNTPQIILSQNEYTISAKEEVIEVELRSNTNYEIRMPDIDWITEKGTRAMASYTHYFTVAENKGYDKREADIVFINTDNNIRETVHIVQSQKDTLFVTDTDYHVNYREQNLSVNVSSNIDFTTESSVDWIVKNNNTRGLSSKTLSFSVAENTGTEAREGIITIQSGELKQSVTVKQSPKPILEISAKEFTADCDGGDIQVEVKSNINYQVRTSGYWIEEIDTRSASTHVHNFHIDKNDEYDSRKATITFYNTEEEIQEDINITQKQKDYITSHKNSYTIEAKGGYIDLEVTSNVDFEIQFSDSWMSQVTTRTLTSNTIRCHIQENASMQGREGTIRLHGGNAEYEIKINQKGTESAEGGIEDLPHINW